MRVIFAQITAIFLLLNPYTQIESNSDAQAINNKRTVLENIDTLRYEKEKNLKNLRQLTFGGDNTEAYFSFDNQYLVFHATNETWDAECDQTYSMTTVRL